MDYSNIEKKVLMVGDVDLTAHANHRFIHFVNYMSSRFSNVDFISYSKLYDGTSVRLLRKINKSIGNLLHKRLDIYNKGNVKYFIVRRLKLPRFFQNLIGDLWAYIVLSKHLRNNHYDICICSGAYNTFLIKLLKRLKIVDKVFYDDFDFLPDGFDVRNSLDSMIIAWKERIIMNTARGVFSVTQSLAELRKEQGAKNVIVVPNGVNLEEFYKARKKVSHPPTIIYMGAIVKSYGVDLILQALPSVRDRIPDIRLIIIGQGDFSSELKRISANLDLNNNVSFVGKKLYCELPEYLQKSDIGIAMYRRRKFTEYNCPLKIKEYMVAGLPVVTSNFGEAKEIISDSKAGELADESPSSVSSAILKIMENPELYNKYSENAIRYAESFDWDKILHPVLKLTISI